MALEFFAARPFTGVFWGLEAVHSAVVALICFIIFLKTREIHQLSQHEGVRYFRKTFLFFGLASLLKLLTRHFAISFFLYPGILGIPDLVIIAGVLGIVYTHTMAAFWLLYSISWKDLDDLRNRPAFLHLTAALISLGVVFTNLASLYLLFQVFVIAYSIGILHVKARARKTPIGRIYKLLLIFWMLNLLDTIATISPLWQAAIYMASFSIFLTILHRVWHRLGVKS